MTTQLKELIDIDRFAATAANGFIGLSRSDDNPNLAVACYTTKTQFAGHWTAETLLARGLVLDLDSQGQQAYDFMTAQNRTDSGLITDIISGSKVIARGMRKFFTVEAANSDWGKVKLVDDDEDVTVSDDVNIDFNAPATLSDKLDGALGIGTRTENGFIIATKGSFRSDEALAGTDIMRTKHDAKGFMDFMDSNGLDGFTPIFEIITPGDFHVVSYGDMRDIVLLGFINTVTGWWIPSALLETDRMTKDTNAAEVIDRFGFVTPQVYSASSLGEALSMPEIANHEGMVATVDNGDSQDLYKVKYPTFLMLQHLKNSTSDKTIRDHVNAMSAQDIMEGKGLDITVPLRQDDENYARSQAIIARINGMAESFTAPLRDALSEALDFYRSHAGKSGVATHEGKKAYAQAVFASDMSVAARGAALKMTNLDATASDSDLLEAGLDSARKTIFREVKSARTEARLGK